MMTKDIIDGVTDVAIFWGRSAATTPRRTASPWFRWSRRPRAPHGLSHHHGRAGSDQNWKRQLNTLIKENQKEINAILLDFGVPLLDEKDRPITN